MTDFAIRFIISAKSGSREDKSLFEKTVKEAFQSHPMPDIQYSRYENHVSDLAKEWADLHGSKGIVYIMGVKWPERFTAVIPPWVSSPWEPEMISDDFYTDRNC